MLPVSSDGKLVPVEGISVGENGTFNSKDTVQLFLLINYLKPLCPVAGLLYSWRISVVLHREPRDGSLACGMPSMLSYPMFRYFSASHGVMELSVTHSYGQHFLFVVWSVTIGAYILFFILKPHCALLITPRLPLQQQYVPQVGGGRLRNWRGMLTFLEVA